MGQGYVVRCPKCDTEFDQYYGLGLELCYIPGCTVDEFEKFRCPKCNHEIDPTSPLFEEVLIGEFDWD